MKFPLLHISYITLVTVDRNLEFFVKKQYYSGKQLNFSSDEYPWRETLQGKQGKLLCFINKYL